MYILNISLHRSLSSLTLLVLVGFVLSLPEQAVSQEPYPSKLSQLFVTKAALIQANNPNSVPDKVHLTLPDQEEMSALFIQEDQKVPEEYNLTDFYLISSQKDLIPTVCAQQGLMSKLVGEEMIVSPLEKRLVTPSEPAWGIVSSKAFLNLGLGSDLALELYLSEDTNPTAVGEEVNQQIAFFDGLKSRILDQVTDMPILALMKSKSSGTKQNPSVSSKSSRGFPIAPFFKWDVVGIVIKKKW